MELEKRLLICGHPNLSRSKFSSNLITSVDRDVLDLHILADHPTNMPFNPTKEMQRIARAKDLVLVFPIHWYGPPSLLVRWTEDALLPSGDLEAKKFLCNKSITFIVSTGGKKSEYTIKGKHERPVLEYLNSICMTFKYFGAKEQKLRIFHATWQLTEEEVHKLGRSLSQL